MAFGAHAYRKPVENPLLAGLPPGALSLNPFVLIDATGITLITPRADVGQGAVSIQTHLLAEELDVDPRPFAPVSGRRRGLLQLQSRGRKHSAGRMGQRICGAQRTGGQGRCRQVPA